LWLQHQISGEEKQQRRAKAESEDNGNQAQYPVRVAMAQRELKNQEGGEEANTRVEQTAVPGEFERGATGWASDLIGAS
jgi:hypothetical protein